MPDITTHVLFGISLAMILSKNDKKQIKKQILIIMGSVLPDLERPISLLLNYYTEQEYYLTEITHSIIGSLLLTTFCASMVKIEEDNRLLDKFSPLFIGSILHILLDLTLWPWPEQGLKVFFPIPLNISFNLFWPGSYYPIIIGLVLLIIVKLTYKIKMNSSN